MEQAQFNYPDGVAYNPVDGNLYVKDFSNQVIRKIIIQNE
jgi:DNA-binding beta-propeller fold protein YncE